MDEHVVHANRYDLSAQHNFFSSVLCEPVTDGEGGQSGAEESTAAANDDKETPVAIDEETPARRDDEMPAEEDDVAPVGSGAGSSGAAAAPVCDAAADNLGGEKKVDSLALLEQLRTEVEAGQFSKERAQEILGELCGLIADAAGEDEDSGDNVEAEGVVDNSGDGAATENAESVMEYSGDERCLGGLRRRRRDGRRRSDGRWGGVRGLRPQPRALRFRCRGRVFLRRDNRSRQNGQ